MNQMFEDYQKEEYGRSVLKTDVGFALYQVVGKELIVNDIYVEPRARKLGHCLKMGKMLEGMAREKGCEVLSCYVHVREDKSAQAARNLYLYTKFGFEPVKLTGEHVVMIKELGEKK